MARRFVPFSKLREPLPDLSKPAPPLPANAPPIAFEEFNYLLQMPIASMTEERVAKMQEQVLSTQVCTCFRTMRVPRNDMWWVG